MNKIKISYFMHFPIGFEKGEYYIKNVLNKYFFEISDQCDVRIISSIMPKEFWHTNKLTNRITFVNKNTSGRYFNAILCLFNEIRKADVIFLFMHSKNSFLCGLISKLIGTKFVTYFGNDWEHLELSSNKPNKFYAFLKRKASLFLSKHSLCSFYTGKGLLKRHLGLNKYLTSPIVNIEFSSFEKRNIYPLLINKKCIRLLYVGGLIKRKGLEYLIHALSEIKKYKIHIDFIGDGNKKESLLSITKKINNNNISFKFHGYLENDSSLFKFYKDSDAFILPSFSEGLPRVLYEAVSQGCPIITTPVNSVPYLFEDNYDSLFIQPGNYLSIREKIIKLIETPGLNEQLANNAFETITPFFKEKPSKQHLRVIQSHLK